MTKRKRTALRLDVLVTLDEEQMNKILAAINDLGEVLK